MATNKNAMVRYRTLDKCLRNFQRRFYIENLIDACSKAISEYAGKEISISRRTIFNDLNFMQSEAGWGAKGLEIETKKDGRRVYYRYTNPKFSIENTPLTSLEISQLDSAINTLSQFRGLPQFEWMDGILSRLKSVEGSRNQGVVGFDHNPYLIGLDQFESIYRAIIDKKVLRITYQAFGWNQSTKYTIHPYYLKEYNNRWFLFGLNEELSIPTWNMALDRIKEINECNESSYIEAELNWEEHFEDIIGVTKRHDVPLEKITLHCYGKSGNYIINKPIHGSQKHRWIDKDCLEVNLMIQPNFELKNYILGQGVNIEVIAPIAYRKEIADEIKKLYKLYH